MLPSIEAPRATRRFVWRRVPSMLRRLINAGIWNGGMRELLFYQASQAEPAVEADAPNSVI